MKIKKYNDFVNEEAGYIKNILRSALVSLGINKMQAQVINKDQKKLDVVNTLVDYNKAPKGLDTLKIQLRHKVENPEKFIHDYLKIGPDKTIVVTPHFINGLNLHYNPNSKTIGFTYHIKF